MNDIRTLSINVISTGLFHKAILQSGIYTCQIAIKETEREVKSYLLASILGIDSKDPKTVVKFLRTIPADEIVKAQRKLYSKRVILFCADVMYLMNIMVHIIHSTQNLYCMLIGIVNLYEIFGSCFARAIF